ncbi:MAG: hypothetical protein LBI47_01270 [Puniceicoccales bacterium]|jgi:hypothetical protein|nr:hypothetical protein [Puniceicoccales bacterium]
MNSLISSIFSPFLPVQVNQAVKFYEDNESRLDGYASEGKKLLKVISTESSDPRALRSTIAGLKQPAKDQALRELGMQNAAVVAKGDFVKKAREAIEIHAQKEATKRNLRDFMANLDAILNEFRTTVSQRSTSSLPLTQIVISMITCKIDTFFQGIDAEVFCNKSKS